MCSIVLCKGYHVPVSVCTGVLVRFGWSRVVSECRLEHYWFVTSSWFNLFNYFLMLTWCCGSMSCFCVWVVRCLEWAWLWLCFVSCAAWDCNLTLHNMRHAATAPKLTLRNNSLNILNYNFSKEQYMFPEDDRVIETCRSVLNVLTFCRRNYFFNFSTPCT